MKHLKTFESFSPINEEEEGIKDFFKSAVGLPTEEETESGKKKFEQQLKDITNKYMKSVGGDMEKVNKFLQTKDDNNNVMVPGIKEEHLKWAAKADYYQGQIVTIPFDIKGGGKGVSLVYKRGRKGSGAGQSTSFMR